ncbi:MAG: DNA repair exonuclease, partial [Clostridiales bacterium]|nr:DNA repair exonuclease [Clostridiales bacterium]
MIRIIHAADLHLDSPFESLDAEKASVRRSEQRALLERIAAEVNQRNADLLFLAGDLLDSGSAYAETGEALLAALGKVRVPVFIAPGNHDPLSAASPYRTERWPVNVHIFASRAISPVELPEQHCRVFGAGFESAYESGLLGGFSAPQDGWVNVMVLHGDALNPNSPYNAVTKEQIAASGLRYLALGHIHQSSGLLRAGGTAYAWPGCTMGRGFDELGEKG